MRKSTTRLWECQRRKSKINSSKKFKKWNKSKCFCPKLIVLLNFYWPCETNKNKKKNFNCKESKDWKVCTTKRTIIKRNSEVFTKKKLRQSQKSTWKSRSLMKKLNNTGWKSSPWVLLTFTSKGNNTWGLSTNRLHQTLSNRTKANFKEITVS